MKPNELICMSCTRDVIRNVHNKCMYCGKGYLEKFHMSKDEIENQLKRVKEKKDEIKEQEEKRRKRDKQKEIDRKIHRQFSGHY